jgi:ADP-ribose pyrophosphatase YjhB (NUDIX family)
VVTEERLLLVRRAKDPWKGMWDVPGGFCEATEHPALTAEREIFEETGLLIRVVGFLGIWLDEYPDGGQIAKRTLNIYYHAIPVQPVAPLRDPSEVAEIGFFSAAELPAALAFPAHLPDALEAWKKALADGQLSTPLLDRAAARD